MTETTPKPPRLTDADWLRHPATQTVLSLLEDAGFGARAVGGAVRNALLGTPVKDIDIATTALPDDVMRLATAAGLGAHPTGIAHGTVTLVHAGTPIEVTTLRRDVATFGRHATVAFTTDWAEDARRRDFTINALYCARDGTVHDPLGGYPDLVARRVRFIGDAEARIREDYLRILRFFRFTAEYAVGSPDPTGLEACARLQPELQRLSGERIRAELLKLLVARRAVEVAETMTTSGTLVSVLGHAGRVEPLRRLAAIERATARTPDAILRLAAFVVRDAADVPAVRDRLRLSAREADRLSDATRRDPAVAPERAEQVAKALLYRIGREAYEATVLMSWAEGTAAPVDKSWRQRLTLPERWTAPALPFSGRDVVARGLQSGPEVGKTLAAFERAWVAADFPDDEATQRALFDTALASTGSVAGLTKS